MCERAKEVIKKANEIVAHSGVNGGGYEQALTYLFLEVERMAEELEMIKNKYGNSIG